MKRTTVSSTMVSSASISRFSWRAVEKASFGASACVSTARTPGTASAASVLIATNAGVRMRRTQNLHVQHAVNRHVERVARLPGHHLGTGRRGDVVAAGGARLGAFCFEAAVERVLDGAIAGAAAQVALERLPEVGALRLVERRRGHDHAGGAEAALEALRVEEGALHGMQFVAAGKALDRRHLAALGAERRDEATVHRLAVERHRAGAAVAGIASLLDAEQPESAQEGAQALAGRRVPGHRLAVDGELHAGSPASSRRISCARCSVMCRRQAGLPWTSS